MMFSNVTTSAHIERTPVLTLNHRHVMWALFLVFHFSFKKFPWHMLSKNLQHAARQLYWQQYLTIFNNSGLIALSRQWKLLKVLTFGYFTLHAYQALVHFRTWIAFNRGCWSDTGFWHDGAKKFLYSIKIGPPKNLGIGATDIIDYNNDLFGVKNDGNFDKKPVTQPVAHPWCCG